MPTESGPGTWEFSQESEDVPFLDMSPDWLERLSAGLRFFPDWQGSSRGGQDYDSVTTGLSPRTIGMIEMVSVNSH